LQIITLAGWATKDVAVMQKDQDRLEVVARSDAELLTQRQAAQRPGVTKRCVREHSSPSRRWHLVRRSVATDLALHL